MSLLEKAGQNCYRIPAQGQMKAEVLIYLNPALYQSFDEKESLQQLKDAASLQGVISPVVGMPDIHSGFGLPIGGVMAMDSKEGLISAGAVGMDINCGVRLLRTNLKAGELERSLLKQLINTIAQKVPSGVGGKSKHEPKVRQYFKPLIHQGVPFLIEMGFGRPEDLRAIEDGGVIEGADLGAVSKEAKNRGLQLSTIGGGNHFIELGYVDTIYDRETARAYGLEEGMLTVLIHTGSRGFGHQICTDYTRAMKKDAAKYKLNLISAGLASVPVASAEGQDYLAAMNCAINFAFCNRQWITDDVRRAFSSVFGKGDAHFDLSLIYDLAHNTARFETIGGREMLIHRKGATRSLPPGHPANPEQYITTGHPVIIPGSMGTASFVTRAEPGVEKIYNSVNHGAGRVLSRKAAKREISVSALKDRLAGVILSGRSYKAYLDEAPQAYKDIDMVVDTFVEIGLSRKVARLLPLAVIKGEG
ncbi:MAG: RtcB family protein [Bacillota bacterium]